MYSAPLGRDVMNNEDKMIQKKILFQNNLNQKTFFEIIINVLKCTHLSPKLVRNERDI